MKRILTLLVVMAMSLQMMAQRGGAPNWISLAGKVGVGTSALLCKQATENEDFAINYMAPSLGFGGRLGVVFVDRVGVSVEYLSSQYQNKSEYNMRMQGEPVLKSNLKFKTGDLLILARYTGEYGFYMELGPKITFVKEVTNELEGNASFLSMSGTTDVTDKFNDKFNSVVFGLGFMPYNGDRVQVSLGLRGAYCGKNVLAADQNVYGFSGLKIQNVEMKPFSAQVMLEVNYHFARFGSATCGKQKIIFFK
ncbi:MAG: hypothetical protein MJZ66_05260 [Bacteroidales bacterium]|nr:hypothetical protein [Bacteroidales bacterium]